MIESHARRSLWHLSVIASLACALILQACSGRVQQDSDCRSGSRCGGAFGAAGGSAEAGSAAVAGNAAGGGAGAGVTLGACENSAKDENESDVDCGGPSKCDRCTLGSRCTASRDCDSNFCQSNRCAESSCADKIRNQDETDIDCGGSCPPCPAGLPCLVDGDCSSEYCANLVCANHCLSGARESDETDTDCGGASCEACADGQRCLAASDCQSQVCSNKSCRAATCTDQVENQDESDRDCGGVCSETSPCPVAARCNTEADCESWLCSASHKCLADIVVSAADVIDDFEDGDHSLPVSPALGGRVGHWYAYSDGSGTGSLGVNTIKRGASSLYGLHVTGQDFKTWGAGFGVDLNNSGSDQSSKLAYDATAYSGLTFWARAQSPTAVTVLLPDTETDAAGQTCSICEHHYYKIVQVTPSWQRFTLAFSELGLEPGGAPVPAAFRAKGMVSLQFRFALGQTYDLYLDDVAFVKN